jgi:hypothetical protein
MSYVLATTETRVRWYVIAIKKVEDILNLKAGEFELAEELNLALVPGFGNKDTAKRAAIALGLKTWRYVKIDTPNQTFTFN